MPIALNGPCSSCASAGSASMPTTREVMVMPSWVPESWKDSSLSDSATATGPSVAFGCGLLGVRRLDRDEAELGGHEEAVGQDQQEGRSKEQQGGGHDAAASMGREVAAQVLQDDPSIAGGSHSSGSRGPLRTGGRPAGTSAAEAQRKRLRQQINQDMGLYGRSPRRSGTRRGHAGRVRRRWHAPWRCPAGCRARAGWCRR